MLTLVLLLLVLSGFVLRVFSLDTLIIIIILLVIMAIINRTIA